jgi:hypothetical protein
VILRKHAFPAFAGVAAVSVLVPGAARAQETPAPAPTTAAYQVHVDASGVVTVTDGLGRVGVGHNTYLIINSTFRRVLSTLGDGATVEINGAVGGFSILNVNYVGAVISNAGVYYDQPYGDPTQALGTTMLPAQAQILDAQVVGGRTWFKVSFHNGSNDPNGTTGWVQGSDVTTGVEVALSQPAAAPVEPTDEARNHVSINITNPMSRFDKTLSIDLRDGSDTLYDPRSMNLGVPGRIGANLDELRTLVATASQGGPAASGFVGDGDFYKLTIDGKTYTGYVGREAPQQKALVDLLTHEMQRAQDLAAAPPERPADVDEKTYQEILDGFRAVVDWAERFLGIGPSAPATRSTDADKTTESDRPTVPEVPAAIRDRGRDLPKPEVGASQVLDRSLSDAEHPASER